MFRVEEAKSTTYECSSCGPESHGKFVLDIGVSGNGRQFMTVRLCYSCWVQLRYSVTSAFELQDSQKHITPNETGLPQEMETI